MQAGALKGQVDDRCLRSPATQEPQLSQFGVTKLPGKYQLLLRRREDIFFNAFKLPDQIIAAFKAVSAILSSVCTPLINSFGFEQPSFCLF